jgi:hypothetical protein
VVFLFSKVKKFDTDLSGLIELKCSLTTSDSLVPGGSLRGKITDGFKRFMPLLLS